MNKAFAAAFAIGIVTSTIGFAQAQTLASPSTGASAQGQAEAPQPKSRAEVYEELVRAKQDGSLDRLNSTIYRHP
jgi:hypothetical protein